MKAIAALLCLALAGCGYRVGTQSDLIPTSARTIAIPAFGNATIRYKLNELMPSAIAREFITRTKYRIVQDPNLADIVMTGAILGYTGYPIIFDDRTARANVAEFRVSMQFQLVERTSGRVLYQRPTFDISERYQISPDAGEYFDESDFALRRAAEQVSKQVVTQILQAF